MLDLTSLGFTREGPLPPLSLTHVRMAGALRDGRRVVASCCEFSRPALPDVQALQHQAAEQLRDANHPMLNAIQGIHVAADAQIVFSTLPPGQSLEAVLMQHRSLEVEEALTLAERLAEVCDLAWANAWPRLRLSTTSIWIAEHITQARLLVPDVPCFGADAALLDAALQGTTASFDAEMFLELQVAPIARTPGDYTGALAQLISAMLGQSLSSTRGNARVAPLAQLTARQNTILRQALSPTQRQQFSSVSEFVRWLWDRDSSISLPADISARPSSAPPSPATARPPFAVQLGLTTGSTSAGPAVTFSGQASASPSGPPPLPGQPPSIPPGPSPTGSSPTSLHTAQAPPPSTTRIIDSPHLVPARPRSNEPKKLELAPPWKDKRPPACNRLRLTPVGHIGPIIGLSATESIILGRGPDADFMAFYWPQTPTNQNRTRLVGRTQAILRRTGKGPVLEACQAANPTLWQGTEAPVNSPLPLPLVLELGGDYRAIIEPLPAPSARRDAEGLPVSDSIITLLPSLRCRPGEHDAGPFVLLWLGLEAPLHMPSPVASRASGVLQEMHVGHEPAAVFHWRADAFWIEALLDGPRVTIQHQIIEPGQLWPLEMGQHLSIAGRDYLVKL